MSTYASVHQVRGGGARRTDRKVPRPRYGQGRHRVPSLVALEWVSVALVGLALVATLVWLAAEPTPAEVPTRSLRVEAGDSLWSIAAAHRVEGLTTEQTVELIRNTNGMTGSMLQTGQLLRVPDPSSGAAAVALR